MVSFRDPLLPSLPCEARPADAHGLWSVLDKNKKDSLPLCRSRQRAKGGELAGGAAADVDRNVFRRKSP